MTSRCWFPTAWLCVMVMVRESSGLITVNHLRGYEAGYYVKPLTRERAHEALKQARDFYAGKGGGATSVPGGGAVHSYELHVLRNRAWETFELKKEEKEEWMREVMDALVEKNAPQEESHKTQEKVDEVIAKAKEVEDKLSRVVSALAKLGKGSGHYEFDSTEVNAVPDPKEYPFPPPIGTHPQGAHKLQVIALVTRNGFKLPTNLLQGFTDPLFVPIL